MSNPNIANITPTISLSTAQTVPLLLASIALEELALAHVVNAEAEKLQLVVGTLTPTRTTFSPAVVSLSNLLAIDASVQRTLRDVIKKEMLLGFKFENVLDLIGELPPTVTFTVTLAADPTIIGTPDCPSPISTSSTLSGQMLVNGSPAPATPVFFTLSDPSLGTITLNPAITNASGFFTATFNASSSLGGTEMITATALGQNSNTVTITILKCTVLAGLTVIKTAPADVAPGGSTQYNINVINTGTIPLTNLTVTDTIPAGTTFLAASPPPGFTASFSAGTVTFTATSPFAPGSSAVLQFTVAAPATPGTVFTNTASANSTEFGPVNSNTTTTTVI